jgi:uncharacterized protein YqjF (DUF2071 family)
VDRITPTKKPARAPQGYHEWRSLLFVHWEVDPAILRPLVPAELEIDTFDGKTFVGLVPFTMQNIRPLRWMPPVPGVSAFHETNVRVYVHKEGRDPGVFFFSLDAASSMAVRTARRFFHLPYFRADMTLSRDGSPSGTERIGYASRRKWPDPTPATLDVEVTVGPALPPSREGSLEFFLAERYFLYAKSKAGALFRGQVHHAPYPLHSATITRMDETLVAQGGVAAQARGARAPDLFSPGVDVDVYALERV